MRVRRVIRSLVFCYAVCCSILAIFPGELAFRPQRVRVNERQSAEATAARFGAALRDVAVTISDGAHLQGWFARPADANGDTVILLHGIGDNRQGMMGFAELLRPRPGIAGRKLISQFLSSRYWMRNFISGILVLAC
jgi:uncharacterized protein